MYSCKDKLSLIFPQAQKILVIIKKLKKKQHTISINENLIYNSFMHLHIAEKLHFYELWNYAIKRKIPIRSIITNRVTECKEQCSEIREYGLYCIGFNFDRTLQQCMLLGEPSTEYDTTSEYDITSFRMIEGMTAYCRMDGKGII